MNLNERLAVVETEISQMKEIQEEVRDTLDALKKSIDSIDDTINKYKGFVGGILFILSSLGIFFSKFGLILWQSVFGKGNG